jgi:hypothetical protein
VFRGVTSQFYPLYSINPHLSQIIAASLLMVAAFWGIDARAPSRSLALVFVPAACLILSVLGDPGGTALLVPATAVYGGASFFLPQGGRERAMRVAAVALALVFPAALGMVTYYRGLVGFTAYNFFSDEFEQTRATLISASTVFWISSFGAWAVAAGCLGAGIVALVERGRLRLIALTHLAATLVFLAGAVCVVRYAAGYKGPSPVYFESAFWPYSLFFAAVVVLTAGEAGLRRIASSARGRFIARAAARAPATVILTLAVLLVGYDGLEALLRGPTPVADQYFSLLRSTAITDYLAPRIGLRPGAPFNGLVATVDGVPDDRPVIWFTLTAHDADLWLKTGNDHRTVGLKQFGIPTLFQYSTYITPPYYLLFRDFLSRPGDRQVRAIVLLSKVDAPIMELWGTRYLIVDRDPGVGTTVARVPVAGEPDLLLKELPDVNLGDYSPTETVEVADFPAGIARMRAAGFDPRRTVLIDRPRLGGPLVPATGARLYFEKYGLRVTAASAGRSILVLPAQYSHCWTAVGASDPRLFRANLMQLGIDFTGRLDAELVFRYGPIFAGECRVDDMNDMERLRIRDARAGGPQ